MVLRWQQKRSCKNNFEKKKKLEVYEIRKETNNLENEKNASPHKYSDDLKENTNSLNHAMIEF